jgi:hypothetical protein
MNNQEIETHHREASASRTLESAHTPERTVVDSARAMAAQPVFMKQIDGHDLVPRRNARQLARPQRRKPKTPAGKAQVSLNAISHGIASARIGG